MENSTDLPDFANSSISLLAKILTIAEESKVFKMAFLPLK